MDKRKVNVIFNKTGRGFRTYKISLPSPWIDEFGLTEEDKAVFMYFENGKIIISKVDIMKRLEGYKIVYHESLENEIEEIIQYYEDTGKTRGCSVSFNENSAAFEPLDSEETNLFAELIPGYREFKK